MAHDKVGKKRPPRWTAYVMRGKRADVLGDVFAETQDEAIAQACEEYGITAPWQRKRVLVRREPD